MYGIQACSCLPCAWSSLLQAGWLTRFLLCCRVSGAHRAIFRRGSVGFLGRVMSGAHRGGRRYLPGNCLQAARALTCILTGCCSLPSFPACVSQSHKESALLHVPSSGFHKQHPNSLPAGEKRCLCQLKTSSYTFLSSLSVYGNCFLQNSSARGSSCFFLPSYFLFSCYVTAG